jgi:hypothetical protein
VQSIIIDVLSTIPFRGINPNAHISIPRRNEVVIIIMASHECSLGEKRNLSAHPLSKDLLALPIHNLQSLYTLIHHARTFDKKEDGVLREGAKRQDRHRQRGTCQWP